MQQQTTQTFHQQLQQKHVHTIYITCIPIAASSKSGASTGITCLSAAATAITDIKPGSTDTTHSTPYTDRKKKQPNSSVGKTF